MVPAFPLLQWNLIAGRVPFAQPDTMHPPPRHPAGGDAAHAGDVLISEFPGAEIWHDVTPAWLYLFKVRFADAGTCTHSGLLN